MEIRSATWQDLEALVRLNRTLGEEHAWALPNVYKEPAAAAAKVWLSEQIAAEGSHTFIAQTPEGQAMGYVLARECAREDNPFRHGIRYMEIDQISVEKPFRRRGVARALYDTLVDVARQRNLHQLQLSVAGFNTGAIAFYEELGFTCWFQRMTRDLDGS